MNDECHFIFPHTLRLLACPVVGWDVFFVNVSDDHVDFSISLCTVDRLDGFGTSCVSLIRLFFFLIQETQTDHGSRKMFT